MFTTTDPTPDEISRLFLLADEVPPGRFEMALVLGGTVSAGAYTAGVLDFLFEALDCFEAGKTAAEPYHDVVLRVIAGTSGGAVNAAIAARALAYDWRHEVRGSPPRQPGEAPDPFHDVWVNRLTLGAFLDPSDINGDVQSLLNGNPIDTAAQWLETYGAAPRQAPRAWLAAPLTVLMTVSNICGVPSRIDFTGGSEAFVDHADHVRFAVHYPGQRAFDPRPDEFTLTFDDTRLAQAVGWADFSLVARSSSAFPLGFPTRQLARPLGHYSYRVVAVPPGPDGRGATG